MTYPIPVSVRSAMSSPAIEVDASAPLARAFELLQANLVRHLCVMKEGQLVGILSDRDLHRAMPSALRDSATEYEEILATVKVERVMTRSPITVAPATSLLEAMRQLAKSRIHALPVFENGHLVGIITTTDCMRDLGDPIEVDVRASAP